MKIDDDTLKQLLRINDELLQLCKFLNEKRDHGNFISPYACRGRPHPHSDRSWQEQIALNPLSQLKPQEVDHGENNSPKHVR